MCLNCATSGLKRRTGGKRVPTEHYGKKWNEQAVNVFGHLCALSSPPPLSVP